MPLKLEPLCKSRMTITHQWRRKKFAINFLFLKSALKKYAGSWGDHFWYVLFKRKYIFLACEGPCWPFCYENPHEFSFIECVSGIVFRCDVKNKWTGSLYKHLMFWFWIQDPGFWWLGLQILNLESVLWIFLCTSSIFPDGTFFSVLWYCCFKIRVVALVAQLWPWISDPFKTIGF